MTAASLPVVPVGSDPDRGSAATADREAFLAAMRRVAQAVSLVTTDGVAGRFGLTVSAMTSVSADPPTMLACVNRASRSAEAIASNGVFAISLLTQAQRELSDVFATRGEDERFSFGGWTRASTGAPVLTDALAWFDCRLLQMVDHATHRILIGRVEAIGLGDGPPLLYADRAYRQLGGPLP